MVHDAGQAGDILGDRDALVLGLVGEHRAGITSPIAQMPGTLVRNSWSVSIWPRWLVCKPGLVEREPVGVGLAPDRHEHDVGLERLGRAARRGLDGQRPPSALALGPGHLGRQPELEALLLEDLVGFLATSASKPGRIWSRNSTTVTCAPSRRQTEPNSSPITPPPMTTMRLGTSGSSSAPVESTIRSWSMVTPGSGVTDEPVAMTMFFAAPCDRRP